MLDLRLYRVTLLPFAVLLIVAAFSLHAPPPAPSSAPPTQSFDGASAAATMASLAAAYPDRAPGSPGDDALAADLARSAAPDGFADAGFTSVRTVSSSIETTAGAVSVRTVIATRPGSGDVTGAGIALIADRGGSQPDDEASLAPTATLLELAAIFKNLLPVRPLTLVSTSGGASAMGAVAGLLPPGLEAAIVIGDTADRRGHGPYVVPWSAAGTLAPVPLRRAVEEALAGALSTPVSDVSLSSQIARLALPLTTGEQGPLGAAGIPAVLVSADGEATAGSAHTDVARIGAFGEGLLEASTLLAGSTTALPLSPSADLAFGSQELGEWAVRAVVGALLFSLLACTLDVLARANRRRIAVRRRVVWVLSMVVPFLLAGLFAAFLGAGGLLPATPAAAVTPAQMPVSGAGAAAIVSVGLLFVLVWVLRATVAARAARTARSTRAGRRENADGAAAGAGLLLVTSVTAALLWLHDPYTAMLLLIPAHIWLVVLTRERERTPMQGAVWAAVSLLPLLAVVGFVASQLHTEPLALVWTVVLEVAGGSLSPVGLLLASLTAGSLVAAAVLLVGHGAIDLDGQLEVTVRGPLSYAGPGSLGGTESALRR